jgi:hypothetical protein
MFFFKKSEIVLDAFTHHAGVYEHFPIQQSVNMMPNWWKQLPKTMTSEKYGIFYEQSTMKKCDGFLDLYKNSISIPNFSELIIQTYDYGEWKSLYSASNMPEIISHSRAQYGPEFDDQIHIKIDTPWVFIEKSGINFYFADPFWSRIKKLNMYSVCPGIVNYKYQINTSVNILLPKINSTVTLDAGDPLVTIIPITDKKVIVKNHLVDISEVQKIYDKHYISSFMGKYKNQKKYLQAKEKKCPFGFDK